MNCSDARQLLEARLDGEPAEGSAEPLLAHLTGCPACRGEEASLRGLAGGLRAALPYHAAPAGLRRDVEALLEEDRGQAPPTGVVRGSHPAPWAQRRRSFLLGSAAGAMAGGLVAWQVLGGRATRRRESLALQLVDAHVHASLAQRRIEVASSDQHTVKPWLSARLDYSPPVLAVPLPGVELAGARIESIDGRPLATLVYRFRAHWIDAFVGPAEGGPVVEAATIRGFNVVPAEGRGMAWQIVSDAGLNVLVPLARRLADAGAASD